MNILEKALAKTILKSGDFKKENKLAELEKDLKSQVKSGKITQEKAFLIYQEKLNFYKNQFGRL